MSGVEVDDDAFNTKQYPKSLSAVEQWKCKHYTPNAHISPWSINIKLIFDYGDSTVHENIKHLNMAP